MHEAIGAFAILPFSVRLFLMLLGFGFFWAFCGVAVAYYRCCKADPNQAIPPLMAVLGVCFSGPLPTIVRIVAWFKAPSLIVLLSLAMVAVANAGDTVTVPVTAGVAEHPIADLLDDSLDRLGDQDTVGVLPFDTAVAKAERTGCDLVVLVTMGEGCPACRRTERETLPALAALLRKRAFAIVDYGTDRVRAEKLLSKSGQRKVPLWIIRRWNGSEWRSTFLVGFQSAATIAAQLQEPASCTK